MPRPRLRPRATPARAAVLLPLLLAGCGGDQPPPATEAAGFAPLHYEFLTPLRLNVSSIDVEDRAPHPDGDLAGRSPVTPDAAMQQMAHDRLVAAGGSGTATFTVTQASITSGADGLTEQLAAKLEVAGGGGAGGTGFAEAHVARSIETPDGVGPAVLYDLTRQAMRDMNVELEYQVRHSLADWLVSADGPAAAVEHAPLEGSPAAPAAASGPLPLAPPAGAAAPDAGAPGAATDLGAGVPGGAASPGFPSAPSAAPVAPPLPQDGGAGAATTGTTPDDAPAAPVLSPPPGYLVPPAGAVPAGVAPGFVPPVTVPQGY